MTPSEALGLGILQGVTEFLPVSSSGHLALAQHWMPGLEEPQLLFDVVVHLGTLFAIVLLLRHRVSGLLQAGLSYLLGASRRSARDVDRRWLLLIVVASVPTAIIGLLLRDTVSQIKLNPQWVGTALLVTALLLLLSERHGKRTKGAEAIGWLDAVLIGAAQGLGVIPGISRSGATVAVALARNTRADVAVEFSILISIPAVLGANALELVNSGLATVGVQLVPLMVGFGAAFFTGLVSLRALQWVVTQRKLLPFAVYCALVGAGAIGFG